MTEKRTKEVLDLFRAFLAQDDEDLTWFTFAKERGVTQEELKICAEIIRRITKEETESN